MKDRTFGKFSVRVTKYAAAEVAGWQQAGILPVVKHFPGHGSATADTHTAKATTPRLTQLRNRDWMPYKKLSSQTKLGVMVGHLRVPELGPQPASVNPRAIQALLRNQLGYHNNPVFSDSVSMKGVGLPMATAAERVIAAGGDVVVSVGAQSPAAMGQEFASMEARIMQAVKAGRISQGRINESVQRIVLNKNVDPCGL